MRRVEIVDLFDLRWIVYGVVALLVLLVSRLVSAAGWYRERLDNLTNEYILRMRSDSIT